MPFDAEISQRDRDLIVLEKARERIARGWCQQVREDCEGNVCIVGAIEYAHGGWLADPYGYVNEHYAPLLGLPDYGCVDGWNDAPGRTQAEVLAYFDAAIARLSGERA